MPNFSFKYALSSKPSNQMMDHGNALLSAVGSTDHHSPELEQRKSWLQLIRSKTARRRGLIIRRASKLKRKLRRKTTPCGNSTISTSPDEATTIPLSSSNSSSSFGSDTLLANGSTTNVDHLELITPKPLTTYINPMMAKLMDYEPVLSDIAEEVEEETDSNTHMSEIIGRNQSEELDRHLVSRKIQFSDPQPTLRRSSALTCSRFSNYSENTLLDSVKEPLPKESMHRDRWILGWKPAADCIVQLEPVVQCVNAERSIVSSIVKGSHSIKSVQPSAAHIVTLNVTKANRRNKSILPIWMLYCGWLMLIVYACFVLACENILAVSGRCWNMITFQWLHNAEGIALVAFTSLFIVGITIH